MYDKTVSDKLFKQENRPVEELIRLNKRLVYKQLTKFNLLNDHEAISLGFEALFNAVTTFTPGKSEFSTYATVCIYNRLGSYIRSINTNIHTNTVHYEEPINKEGLRLVDILESPTRVESNILIKDEVHSVQEAFNKCYTELTNETQKSIIKTWAASNFTATHVTIAESLGCTQSYVSQTIKRFRISLKGRID